MATWRNPTASRRSNTAGYRKIGRPAERFAVTGIEREQAAFDGKIRIGDEKPVIRLGFGQRAPGQRAERQNEIPVMQRLDVPGDDRQRLRLPEHSGTAVVEQHPAGGVIDDIDIPVVGRETLHLQILSGTPAVPVNDERHAARHVVGHDLAASEVADIDQPVPEQQFIGAPERRGFGKLQRQEIHPTDPIRNRRRRLLPESQHTVADDPLLPSGNAGGKSA